LEDVQNYGDGRRIDIDQVGVRELRYPISVMDRENQVQQTIARISMAVGLPHHFKGTHMSRFIEVLNEHRGELTMRTLPSMLSDLKGRLDAETARVEVSFPYFIERSAPVSGAEAPVDYECEFIAEANGEGDDFVLAVRVPVTTLCPCSKTISEYGAHNQRGYIKVQVRTERDDDGLPQLLWIEELIELAEKSGSAPVYSLLKRSDERHVTMQAYDNPVFVEDVVRNVSEHLRADSRVAWYFVEAETLESIHHHNAYAQVTWKRPSEHQVEEAAEVADRQLSVATATS